MNSITAAKLWVVVYQLNEHEKRKKQLPNQEYQQLIKKYRELTGKEWSDANASD